MQILLLNQNATIERLVKLSSGKMGFELTNAKDLSEISAAGYNFVIIDGDLYDDDEFNLLKSKFPGAKYMLMVSKGAGKPLGFDVYIEKPFLPTELVDIFSSFSGGGAVFAKPEEKVFEPIETPKVAESDDFGEINEDDLFGDGNDFTFEEKSEPDISDTLDDEEFSLEAPNKEEEFNLDDELTANDDFGDLDSAVGEKDIIDEINLDDIENEVLEKEDEGLDLNNDNFDFGDDAVVTEEEANLPEKTEDFDFDGLLDGVDDGKSVESDDFDFGDIELDEVGKKDEDDVGEFDFANPLLNDDELQLDDDKDELGGNPLDDEDDFSLGSDDEITLDDDMGDYEMDEDSTGGLGENMDSDSEHSILDEDEVNKLKNLLDETDDEEDMGGDDFDVSNIKITNDELGSLTEESLAEALGVSLDIDTKEADVEEPASDFSLDDFDTPIEAVGQVAEEAVSTPVSAPILQAAPVSSVEQQAPAKALEINPNQSITISLDALRELLEIADISINITLSKKK